MSEIDAAKALWPTYALRAWLGALMAQIRRTRQDLEIRIDAAEKEVARLRRQDERAGSVIELLQDAIGQVDERLREVRDTHVLAPAEKRGEPEHERSGDEHAQHRAAESGIAEHEHPSGPISEEKESDGPSPTRGPGRRR